MSARFHNRIMFAIALALVASAATTWPLGVEGSRDSLSKPLIYIRPTRQDAMASVWSDVGSGADTDFNAWHARIDIGSVPVEARNRGVMPWGSLGSYGCEFYTLDVCLAQLPAYQVMPAYALGVINSYSIPIGFPSSYNLIWTDKGSGAKEDGSIWRPYSPYWDSIGDVFVKGYSPPSTNLNITHNFNTPYLVTASCTAPCAKLGDSNPRLLWSDKDSGADKDVSVYTVGYTVDNNLGLGYLGTFKAQANYKDPAMSTHICVKPECLMPAQLDSLVIGPVKMDTPSDTPLPTSLVESTIQPPTRYGNKQTTSTTINFNWNGNVGGFAASFNEEYFSAAVPASYSMSTPMKVDDVLNITDIATGKVYQARVMGTTNLQTWQAPPSIPSASTQGMPIQVVRSIEVLPETEISVTVKAAVTNGLAVPIVATAQYTGVDLIKGGVLTKRPLLLRLLYTTGFNGTVVRWQPEKGIMTVRNKGILQDTVAIVKVFLEITCAAFKTAPGACAPFTTQGLLIDNVRYIPVNNMITVNIPFNLRRGRKNIAKNNA